MEAYTQAISSNVEPVRSHAGADGHLLDFHANGSEKTLFVCALIAARNLNEVHPMINQLLKKDELVILMNQFSATVPPARNWSALIH